MTFANPDVLEFYKTLPFIYRESINSSVEAIRSQDPRDAYPVLKPLLPIEARVLDVGCGTGWFSNSLAHHCHCSVTGIDFNTVAIERARAVAQALNLSSTFEVADLFRYEPADCFDLVVSLGVLHHTNDCVAAVRRVCRFVKPGGHVFIGLYHKYGRHPFLDHFRKMKQNGASEEAMLERYRALHPKLRDETMLRSWFRDQVLHPHETQHTLEEIVPVIGEEGMELISTSINRFGPVHTLAELYATEKMQTQIAEQRLKRNEYFTGFFVFLAHKRDDRDTKPYIEHDARIGYRYSPNVNLMLPRPGGGRYHLQTNSQGIRTSREYALKRPSGVIRAIVCGDSMSAGQFVSNDQRFSELLERRAPGLEVINLSLEGSGTDQQLMLYETVGLAYEHDLVILMPFLSNLRRNMVTAREAIDAKTGSIVLRAKPRFELVNGRLELRNATVPNERTQACVPTKTDSDKTLPGAIKTIINPLPGVSYLKKLAFFLFPWEPFPEFRDARSPQWQLMEAIIRRFKASAGKRPLVVVPTFYDSYVRYRMSRAYWDRFESLQSIPGVYVIDLLPHFKMLGVDAIRCFQVPYDMHFSSYGHLVVADVLKKELIHLGLLAEHGARCG